MVQFSGTDDVRGARFVDAGLQGAVFRLCDLTGAQFDQSSLTGAVMRGVDLQDAEIDGNLTGLTVNGVAVAPLVEAALNERFPGRAQRRSLDPAEQLAAFDAAQERWSAVIEQATVRPELRDARVGGEWSVAQTVRHLVFATDGWVRHAVLGLADAFSPVGLPFTEWEARAAELGIDVTATPSWEDVLAVRAERVAQVRAVLAAQTAQTFAAPSRGLPPWADDAPEHYRRTRTVARCLGVVGNEEWEHLRFVLRDLAAIDGGSAT